MACLLDTSVLVRLANSVDAAYPIAVSAVAKLHRRGDVLHVTAQNLVEFRAVATRPTMVNGLGLTAVEAERKASGFESAFPLLPETPDIFPAWKQLVAGAGVVGKQVHDARLVAVCQVHQVTHLLTFNTGHFTRFMAVLPGLTILDPASV